MKMIRQAVIGAMALSFASVINSHAVDQLQISVPATNAILSWSSLTGETYIVQSRQTLSTTDSWSTLASYVTAVSSTNVTYYTDPNGIQSPIPGGVNTNGGGGGGGGIMPPGNGGDIGIAGTGFYRVLGVRVVNGLTNGMVASDFLNVQTLPDAGANYVELLANGQSFPAEDALVPPFTDTNSVTFGFVDTSRLANGGPYTLQVEAGWYAPFDAVLSSGYEQAYSQPFSIYVTNEISYPDWEDDAGDGWASFNLQSLHPAVDWEIDIYNYYDYLNWYYGYTDSIYPIHVATGSTTNGAIDYQWNLQDDSGNFRTNLDDDPAFVSFTYTSWTDNGGLSGNSQFHPNIGGSASKQNPLIQNDDWPTDGGYWTIEYQDMYRNAYDDWPCLELVDKRWVIV